MTRALKYFIRESCLLSKALESHTRRPTQGRRRALTDTFSHMPQGIHVTDVGLPVTPHVIHNCSQKGLCFMIFESVSFYFSPNPDQPSLHDRLTFDERQHALMFEDRRRVAHSNKLKQITRLGAKNYLFSRRAGSREHVTGCQAT